jgi:hypothetical protein
MPTNQVFNPYAQMGYVGSLQLESSSNTNVAVRVTSSDVKTTQEITYPEVIDGKIDTTLYQLGPKVTGGSIAFPLVHEGKALSSLITDTNCISTADTLAATIWAYGAQRNNVGRLANQLTAHVRYSDNTAFDYPGCYINTMTFSVTSGELVNVTAELFGGSGSGATDESRQPWTGDNNPTLLSPARIVTWNDALVEVYDDSGNDMLTGAGLREFTVTLNNGLERVYTLNGQLSAFDIVAKKREISGTLKVLGRSQTLASYAYGNETRFTSNSAIAFGYTLGGNTTAAYWANAFYGVIFNIEEMAMTTGVFETTHNWRALGDCTRDFLATNMGASNVTLVTNAGNPYPTLPVPPASDETTGSNPTYGASTGCSSSTLNGGSSDCFPSGFTNNTD